MRAKRFWAIVTVSPFLIALILCFVAWMCRQPTGAIRARWLTGHGYEEMPVQVDTYAKFIIPASGNGQPLRLLMDTGGDGFGLIGTHVAEGLGLQPEWFPGHEKTSGILVVNDFTVGDLHWSWRTQVKSVFNDYPYDGTLDNDFLARAAAVIDFGSGKVFFRKQQPSGANGMVDGFAGLLKRKRYLEVPLCYGKRSRFPIIAATLEGGAVRLGVDTGSASNYLLPSVAERLHLPEYGPPQQIRNSHTGRQTLYRTRAKAFSLAGQTEALEALLLDLDWLNTARKKRGDPALDGILGTDFLQAHAGVIDLGSPKLYLRWPAINAPLPSLAPAGDPGGPPFRPFSPIPRPL
jgi:hypothetical protein